MANVKPKAGKIAKAASFDEYKAIKDEIIDISELRFENILARRLKEFKNGLIQEIDDRNRCNRGKPGGQRAKKDAGHH